MHVVFVAVHGESAKAVARHCKAQSGINERTEAEDEDEEEADDDAAMPPGSATRHANRRPFHMARMMDGRYSCSSD